MGPSVGFALFSLTGLRFYFFRKAANSALLRLSFASFLAVDKLFGPKEPENKSKSYFLPLYYIYSRAKRKALN